jgi:hypothetical protein
MRFFVVTSSHPLSTLWGCPLVSPEGNHPALSELLLQYRMTLSSSALFGSRIGTITSAVTDFSCAVVIYENPPFHDVCSSSRVRGSGERGNTKCLFWLSKIESGCPFAMTRKS